MGQILQHNTCVHQVGRTHTKFEHSFPSHSQGVIDQTLFFLPFKQCTKKQLHNSITFSIFKGKLGTNYFVN